MSNMIGQTNPILSVCFEISAHAQWGVLFLGEFDCRFSLCRLQLCFYVVINVSAE